MEEGGEFGQSKGEAFGRGRAEGDVAEFAAGAGRFAIEMGVGIRNGEDFGRFGEFADQIQHGTVTKRARRAKREAENGPKMILKLAGHRAFDGPMTGIVDARSHFVGEKVALVFEKFDGEDTDIF